MAKGANDHWKRKHGSCHHIIASSIGGPDVSENKYLWSQKKHAAYHQLFYNYLPSVVIGIINLWTDKDGKLKLQIMGAGNIKAWQTAFSGGSPAQVITFIQKNFLPAEKRFLKDELGGGNGKKKKKNR